MTVSSEPKRWPHFAPLDGLRGMAIALVLLHHLLRIGHDDTSMAGKLLGAVSRVGWIGVDLFFVLSGFLITGLLIAAKGRPRFFRTFFARRTLRIFPLYYAFLALAFLLLPLIGMATPAPSSAFPWFAAYGTNVLIAHTGDFVSVGDFSHLWSLAVEEQFYLVWPLVIFFLPVRWGERACALVIAAALLLRLYLAQTAGGAVSMYVLLPTRMDSLVTGAWLAFRFWKSGSLRSLRVPAAALGTTAFASFLLIAARSGGGIRFEHPYAAAVAYSLLAMASGAVIVLCTTATPGSWAYRSLTSRPLAGLGKYSYGIYVLHVLAPGLVAAAGLGPNDVARVAGTPLLASLLNAALWTALAITMALVSWHVLERPVIGLKRLFPYSGGQRDGSGGGASEASTNGTSARLRVGGFSMRSAAGDA